MGFYKVIYQPSALKELQKLPKEIQRAIFLAVEELSKNPFYRGIIKLVGYPNLYRFRVRDYRIVFEVDFNNKTITIFRIRHRKEIYRGI